MRGSRTASIERLAGPLADRTVPPFAIGSRSARASIVVALCLGACAQPISGVPPRDANADSPRGETGPLGAVWGPGGGARGGTTRSACLAQLLVVFDRSGSMATEWDGGVVRGPRWRLAADALTTAIEPLADRLEVGAILFPTFEGAPGECAAVDPIESQLDFRDGSDFVTAWRALWGSPDIRGSTPIDSAFDSADDALESAREVTVVVLLTDGEPTCSGPVSAVDRAAAWHARGIDTWVVGLPGTGGSGVLDAIAAAGGSGAALSVEDPAALTAGLRGVFVAQVDQACGD